MGPTLRQTEAVITEEKFFNNKGLEGIHETKSNISHAPQISTRSFSNLTGTQTQGNTALADGSVLAWQLISLRHDSGKVNTLCVKTLKQIIWLKFWRVYHTGGRRLLHGYLSSREAVTLSHYWG